MTAPDNTDQTQAERYNRLSAELRYTVDPIEAFNRFIELEVGPMYHSHFADSDDNTAEFVRRIIQRSADQRLLKLLDEFEQLNNDEPLDYQSTLNNFIKIKRLNLTKKGE